MLSSYIKTSPNITSINRTRARFLMGSPYTKCGIGVYWVACQHRIDNTSLTAFMCISYVEKLITSI